MSMTFKGKRITVYVESEDDKVVTAIVLPTGGELSITDDIVDGDRTVHEGGLVTKVGPDELVGVTLTVNVEFPAETPYELWFNVNPPKDPAQEPR